MRTTEIILMCLLPLFFACSGKKSGFEKTDKGYDVTVTINPLKSLADSIGGEFANIRLLLPANAEPHTFEPSAKDVEKLTKTALLIEVGLGLDEWATKLAQTANPGPRVVSVGAGIPTLPAVSERYGKNLKNQNKVPKYGDPHVWGDPLIVSTLIVPTIVNAFIAADPKNEKIYLSNGQRLKDRLTALSAKTDTLLAPLRGKSVILQHGSFSYFCRRYGITVLDIIEPFPDVEPSPKDIEEIIKIGKEKKAIAVLSEPLISQKPAQIIAAELNIPIITLDALGLPGEGYIEMMKRNIQEIAKLGK
jgi:zinc transport system substrate-binding protein